MGNEAISYSNLGWTNEFQNLKQWVFGARREGKGTGAPFGGRIPEDTNIDGFCYSRVVRVTQSTGFAILEK